MKTSTFDFGSFEHYDKPVLVIVINENVVVDGELSRKLVGLIDEALNVPSVLIIDRRNDYSYSGSGLVTLKESNIPNVLATGIVTYTPLSDREVGSQVNVRGTKGRRNLSIFSTLDHAMSWADDLLAQP